MRTFPMSGNLIRNYRLAAKISQADLSKKLKCHVQTISNCERGIAYLPAMEMRNFAKLLGRKDVILNSILIDTMKNNRDKSNAVLRGEL